MKLHIITEDSASGRAFWESINKHILESKANIIPAGGITNLEPVLKSSIRRGVIHSTDYVLIAFDNTGSLQAALQVEKIRRCSERYGLSSVIFTTYYCFEEVFLSFEYLIQWVNPKISKTHAELIRLLGNSIRNKQDYIFEQTEYSDSLRLLLRARGISTETAGREKIASNLLGYVTGKSIGFRISKDKLGICWTNNCCQTAKDIVSKSNGKISKFIKNCGVGSYLTAEDKLRTIDKHSVLSSGGFTLRQLSEIAEHIESDN